LGGGFGWGEPVAFRVFNRACGDCDIVGHGFAKLSMKDSRNPIKSAETQTPRIQSRLEIAFWLLAIVLGFFHAWADHHYLTNDDAMSYLDIAAAYLRRDWATAVNSYWSPLYSWLIALAVWIARPSPYWKFAVVHLVNFAMYLFALICFGFLMRETIRSERSEQGLSLLPNWALLAIGYSLFIWSSLFLITIQLESPDMLVAAFVYLATGILQRMRRRPGNWSLFVLLGIVLGVGYLAKSVMFLLAPVFIIASVFSAGSLRRALPRIAVTIAFFILVAGPFVFAMSRAKGGLTTGRSGRLNYLWTINRVTNPHWQGEEPGTGTPAHPTRKIFADPPAFEFDGPIGGTYPVWYDPTYWYEGSVSHFDFRGQLGVLAGAIKSYYQLFYESGVQYGLLVALVALYLVGRRGRLLVADLIQQWSLLIPGLAGLGLYALVNVQGRYVASFVVLLWLGLFAAVRLPRTDEAERFIKALSVVLAAAIVFTTAASSSGEAISSVRQLVAGEDPSAHEQWQVAEGLREKGVTAGDGVAFIGNSFRAFWAHLAGLQIIAEVRRDKVGSFWEADANRKRQVIDAFARTGAKAVVAETPPAGIDLNGWQRIRQTNYYVYPLKQ
jgi:hypothetical protein